MADTRNPSLLEELESLQTDQLDALDKAIHQLRDFRSEMNKTLNQHQLSSLPALGLLAKKDVYLPTKEDKESAAKLLAHVDHADYDDIEKIWKKNPELMFVEVKDKDGHATTPLKRAFYNLDTYSWKPFYDYLKKDKNKLLPEFFKQKEAQKEAQKAHIDLEPLFDAYATYNAQAEKWVINEISDKEIDNEWLKLGKKQREWLPMAMLREFCREGDAWSPTSTFDVNKLSAPKGGRIYNLGNNNYIQLDSKAFDSSFGSSFALLRAWLRDARAVGRESAGAVAGVDADTFRHLFDIRTQDLANTISQDLSDDVRTTNKL